MYSEKSSLVLVVHCYDHAGFSSLWFLKGVSDPTTEEALDVDDYHKHYLLIADHLTNRLARDLADCLMKVFDSLEVEVELFGLPDD